MKIKQPKSLPENPSNDQKIAFLLELIEFMEKERAENTLLKKAGYTGAGLSGTLSALGTEIPDIGQMFPASVDPSQLWYIIPILLVFSLSMKGLESYEEKQAAQAKEVIEILKKRKNSGPTPPEL